MRQRIILIPAYEPDQKLIELLKELREQTVTVIVVDDGSGQAYSKIFEEASDYARVISYPENHGKGYALKTGLAAIKKNFTAPYTVVTADADGQHKVDDILNCASEADIAPKALILGSRKIEDHTPLRSKFGNTLTRGIFKLSTGRKVYDTQTGLRAFTDQSLDFIAASEGDRYEYEMNMLMDWAESDREFREIWIETVYLDDNKSSHFHTIRDSYRVYKEIFKFSGASFLSFLLDYGLFCLLYLITDSLAVAGALVISNIVARIASASFNFALNRKAVFKSKEPIVPAALKYAALAISILVCNTVLLWGLTNIGLPSLMAKILVELLLSVASYAIQKRVVFRHGKETGRGRRLSPGSGSVAAANQ